MKPQISREVYLPLEYPFLKLVADVSTKASKCQICLGVIPKGSPRVYAFYKRPWRKWPEKQFMHSECLAAMCEGEKVAQRCDDCGNVCRDETHRIALVSGKTYRYVYVCDDCTLTKRYRSCDWCGSLYPRAYVSKVINDRRVFFGTKEKSIVDYLVCNSCAYGEKCDTINTEIANSKENAWMNEQYLKILSDIADGDMFGDIDG